MAAVMATALLRRATTSLAAERLAVIGAVQAAALRPQASIREMRRRDRLVLELAHCKLRLHRLPHA